MDSVDSQVAITIRHLHQEVRMIKTLQRHLNKIIDSALAEYLEVATIKKQTLILIADNASIATHVKLIAPAIVEGMTKFAPELNITAIKCKVKKPIFDGSNLYPKREAHLSNNAAKHINQTAQGIKNDRLREALQKLGKNAKAAE